MIALSDIQRVYLVGIGGIGMSGLARYFKNRGCKVYGYDRTETPLTINLIDEGIDIIYDDAANLIPKAFAEPGEGKLVIFTPAIPAGSEILNYFKDKGFLLQKRSQVLGLISKGMFTIAVAGTHGKTTTSSMVAHLLKHSGNNCSAFLGGIATNYDSNVLFGDSNVMVVEADEYDRSFLALHPDIAIVTSMDADHLDIYGDKSHLTESFQLFASQLKAGGQLIFHEGLDLPEGITYSGKGDADVMALNIRIENGDFCFDFSSASHTINDITLRLPGLHNVENAVAAIQAALLLGIESEKIPAAVAAYRGVKRRFEYIVKTPQHIYIDDYAHHPEELRACISAIRALYPGKTLTTIFQPHLFTRTRDFASGFSEVLSMSDDVLLLDIYPARELPIAGVSSEMLLASISAPGKRVLSKEDALAYVQQERPELLLTVGAGDIDTLVEPLKKILTDA